MSIFDFTRFLGSGLDRATEAELEEAAANGDINIWAMTISTRACVPVPASCFVDGDVIVLRTSALDGFFDPSRAGHLRLRVRTLLRWRPLPRRRQP